MKATDSNLIEPSYMPDCRTPKRIESLKGYMLRLATINGYNSLRFIYKVAGFKGFPGNFHRINFSSLSVLFDLEQKVLKGLAYEKISRGRLKFLGYNLPANQVLHTRPKMCVACVEMNLTFPVYWDLALFVACPTHKTYLLAECPKCRKSLNWHRPKWNECDCGYNFCYDEAEKAPKAVLDIMDLILCSLKLLDKNYISKAIPSKLLDIEPGDLISALAWIGCWDTNRYSERINRAIFSCTLAEKSEIVIAAHRCLTNWPYNFIEFLERNRMKKPMLKINAKLFREFDGLYYTLTCKLGASANYFFKKAFLEFDEKDRAKNSSRILNSDDIKDTKLYGAAKEAGVTAIALKKMSIREGIKLRAIDLPYTAGAIRVDTDSLNDLSKRISNGINFKQLYSLLGLSHKTAVLLRNDGYFSQDTQTIWDGRSSITYHLDEIHNLLADFNSLAIPTKKITSVQLTPISKVFQFFCSQDFTRKELLELIRNKTIKLYKDQLKANFHNFFVDKEEITSEMLKKVISEGGLVSLKCAVKKYKLSESTITGLLKNKMVEFKKVRCGARYYLLIFEKSLKDYLKRGAYHQS